MTSRVRFSFVLALASAALLACAADAPLDAAVSGSVVSSEALERYVRRFNTMEDENVTNFIASANSAAWLRQNIPRFECPDGEVEEIYYFRWWSFRKHIKQTTNGFVMTEFLVPVGHAGAHNTISCAVGHHLAEGRWLRDQRWLDDYVRFWLRGNEGKPQDHLHRYSHWFAAAVYDRYLVHPDGSFVTNLLADLVADYQTWECEQGLPDGLFWQYDVRDGMEESISGSRTEGNARPTLNSYLFAHARAVAAIARLAGNTGLAKDYDVKAAALKRLVQTALWDPSARFFKVRLAEGRLSDAREAIGFIPWCFGLPDPGYEEAWRQLTDPQGFRAPYGLTTAERRHPQFRSHGCCTCEWDGAVWPFATSQTLVALANVLRDYPPAGVTARDYFDAFLTYVHSQHYEGKPYIGEYLDETTGQWLKGRQERSRYYNHSTFADLLIAGLVGLRPRADGLLEVHPLLPADTWDWFCLDGVSYHGHALTVVWDKDGNRYGRGAGLIVLADGRQIARSTKLERITGRLP